MGGCLQIIKKPWIRHMRRENIPLYHAEAFYLFLLFFRIWTLYSVDNPTSFLSLPCCEFHAFIKNRHCKAHNSMERRGWQSIRVMNVLWVWQPWFPCQALFLKLGHLGWKPGSFKQTACAIAAGPPAASQRGGQFISPHISCALI